MERLVEWWMKRDPYLLDQEGFDKWLAAILPKYQKLEELKPDVSILDWAHNHIERKKYSGISAVFAMPFREEPFRFSGLYHMPIHDGDYLEFLERKKSEESRGNRFLCIQVRHEECLDHHPERPHVKGCFSIYTYYDDDWNEIEKPKMLKLIDKHLNRVSKWYNTSRLHETKPYPTPPAWED